MTDRDGVRDAYDAVADDYAAWLPDTRAESALELALVDDLAHAVRAAGAEVLDAGCGAGRMSRHLADRGCRVEGVDLSPRMVEAARRDHPDLRFAVASLDDLPHDDDRFGAVLLWYSIIHTGPGDLPRVLAEVCRVVRPGGQVLVGFQLGEGTRDVSAAYRRHGHAVELSRHLHPVDEVARHLGSAGVRETCRLVRAARGHEREPQAFLLGTVG